MTSPGRHWIALVGIIFLLVVGVMGEASLWGGQKKKTRLEIRNKSRDLEKVTAELEKKKQEKEQLQKEANAITKKVKQGTIKIYDVEKSLLFTVKKTGDVKQELNQAKNQRDQLLGEMEENDSLLKQSVQLCYLSAQLQGPRSLVPVFSHQLLRTRFQDRRLLIKEEEDVRDKMEDLSGTYDIYKHEMEKQETVLGQLRSGVAQEERKLEKVKTRKQLIETELRDLETTARELASLIDILRSKEKVEKEEEDKARLAKLASGASPIPRRSLTWPVQGEITRKFGRQKHPELGTPYISNGIMIAAGQSQPVRVVSNGHVLYAGEFMSYGPMTVVEHPGDWYTVYGNMSRWAVEKGQEIQSGDVVGWTGLNSQGLHEAYFELRFYGKPIDPVPWLIQTAIAK